MNRFSRRLQGRMWRLLLVLFVCQGAAGAASGGAEELIGTAVKVFDGDSFILKLATGVEAEIRLQEIDAPEKDQPYANKARSGLRELIYRKKLRLAVSDIDRYGRKVVRAYRIDDGLDINAEMVKRGHAWVYRRYARDRSLFVWEKQARRLKLGLWALSKAQRTPPWEWRRRRPAAPKAG